MTPIRVLLTIAGVSPEFGGPSQTVPALALSLARAGAEVELLTCESSPRHAPPVLPAGKLLKTHVFPYANRTTRWLPRLNALASVLGERCEGRKDCVIHDHGLWLPTNHAAAYVARKSRCPFIISPRGMLTEWAVRFKGFKKRIAWWLYQRRDLGGAQILHATSRAEAEGFRAAGLPQPIAVIPNGVEMPPVANLEHPVPNSGPRTLLFLGRVHPIKGLVDLVKAWAVVRPCGWRVVIAGRNDNNHQAELEAEIRTHGVGDDFSFPGAVAHEARWDLYRQAELFVLPSHSENFGIVVAEALACGVPVIATRSTPWEDLVTSRCGWWTENGPQPLSVALRDALSHTEEERREMGRRGRLLVERKYSWPGIAEQMLAVYRVMLGAGPKPDSIQTLDH